jgi:DNA-binding winged helix-turn-helix (wHTH) protein
MSTPMMSASALSAHRESVSAAKTPPRERYLAFGPFQVDLQREELFKEGSRIHVPAKVYQVLLALLENPGEIVTRDALRARLWPGGTFVNYDANVNTTVNKLRIALGDSSDQPIFVETIPRQGYCFLGSVTSSNELTRTTGVLTIAAPDAIMEGASQSTPMRSTGHNLADQLPRFFKSGWAAAVVLCGMLIGVVIVLIRHRPL